MKINMNGIKYRFYSNSDKTLPNKTFKCGISPPTDMFCLFVIQDLYFKKTGYLQKLLLQGLVLQYDDTIFQDSARMFPIA